MHDWELGSLSTLLGRLGNFTMNEQIPDRIRWVGCDSSPYSVKMGYRSMCEHNGIIDSWPWKLIWKTKLPTKVTCFTWTVLKKACLTQDNLCKRSFQLVNRCYLCQQSSESINHLFLHCPVATDMWYMFLSILGISWTQPQGIREAVEGWSSWKVERAIKKVWKMIPACIFWCLWQKRNRRCFDGISTSMHALKAKCLV
ncbi:PREDICTED: uncharacterized protein LOC109230093 [Nicotiana attenuata]|uniref:uncharacterized protein LOC109230093 n=1 Tax=Nicotiana attenuata TaxID=49451 RepID=UPI000905753A|nr:PREDICTED: uncharacterized protein LOC109230093 [Nicotiana attenuata]